MKVTLYKPTPVEAKKLKDDEVSAEFEPEFYSETSVPFRLEVRDKHGKLLDVAVVVINGRRGTLKLKHRHQPSADNPNAG